MKAKDLICILSACDPETEVTINVGRNKSYRELYAQIALNDALVHHPGEGLECLKNQYIYGALIEGGTCTLISEQQYFKADFIKEAKDYFRFGEGFKYGESGTKTNQGGNS